MKTLINLSALLFILLISSCTKEYIIETEPEIETKPVTRENISGYVQKGPFAIGTSVTITELDSLLSQTGRNFNAQITSNNGNFYINNIVLENNIVEIKADGFYFNEINGEISENRLTLYSLSDLTDQNTVNVNVLSNLEKPRIEYLVENGKTFKEAKKQAQKEVLKIFEIEKADIANSEKLDISKDGEDNGILLAASVILQGRRSVAELSELLAKISLDLRNDGILDDTICGSELINHVKIIKLNNVRSNIEYKYNLMGETDTIPDFEQFVNNFIDKTNFKYTLKIEYPRSGNYGINLLNINDGEKISSPASYSLKAILPLGFNLRIMMTRTSENNGNSWYYYEIPLGDLMTYDYKQNTQEITELTTKNNVTDADQKITFEGSGTGKIEFFENGESTPTKTVGYSWGPPAYTGITYYVNGRFGENIFKLQDNSSLKSGQTYSLQLSTPSTLSYKLNLYIIRTSGTGTLSIDKSQGKNWDANLYNNNSCLNCQCSVSGTFADLPIIFNGTGECTVELRAENSSIPVIMFKHFKWE